VGAGALAAVVIGRGISAPRVTPPRLRLLPAPAAATV
jgi:hypothetical protein